MLERKGHDRDGGRRVLPRRGRRDPAGVSRTRARARSSATTRPRCGALAGDLHEADTGDLIEALDPELRPRFVELMGRDFDFTALTEVDDTVREEILEELPPTTVAEGVRDLDSDDAAYILEDLPKAGAGRNPRAAAAARARRARAHPALSGRLRRPPHADRVHRRAAVVDRRPRHRPHARDRRSAGPLLRALCRRRRAQASRRGRRSTGCCAPSGRCRSPI